MTNETNDLSVKLKNAIKSYTEGVTEYMPSITYREYMSEVRNRLAGDDLKLFDFKIVLKWPYIKTAEEL